MLETLLSLWLLPPALCLGYLMLLALFGLRLREPEAITGEAMPWQFHVLIPVHNQEDSINALIDSLQLLDYPAEQMRIIFIADHCDDSTAHIIRGRGMLVTDRWTGARGKQAVLAEAVQALLPEMGRWDALVVLGGNSVVDPQFLNEVAKMLDAGHPVIQGNAGIHNHDASIFTRLNHVNISVTNRLKELARTQAGLTCRLRGHGMVFHADVLRTLDWDSAIPADDDDMLRTLILNEQRAVWAHQAHIDRVIDDKPPSPQQERKRWAGQSGKFNRKAIRKLAGRSLRRGDVIAFDLMIEQLLLSYSTQLAMILIGLFASVALLGPDHLLTLVYSIVTCGFFGYFALGCHLERVPFGNFFTFFFSPIFIARRLWGKLGGLAGARGWD